MRPFRVEDAAVVQQLAGAVEVYRTTLNVPHPYEDGMAEKWIGSHGAKFHEGRGVTLAMTLAVTTPCRCAELGVLGRRTTLGARLLHRGGRRHHPVRIRRARPSQGDR